MRLGSDGERWCPNWPLKRSENLQLDRSAFSVKYLTHVSASWFRICILDADFLIYTDLERLQQSNATVWFVPNPRMSHRLYNFERRKERAGFIHFGGSLLLLFSRLPCVAAEHSKQQTTKQASPAKQSPRALALRQNTTTDSRRICRRQPFHRRTHAGAHARPASLRQ